MKKILVIGLSDNLGGIETFFHAYYQNMDRKELHFDFATVDDAVAFSDEYKKGGSTIFKLPSFMKHPIKYYRMLRKIMRENKYDIVHINMLSAANILPIKAAKKEKIEKIIVHSHNSGIPNGVLRKTLDKINRHTLKDDNLTKLACGKKAGEWLFGKDANFTIINNAIDTEKFRYNAQSRAEIRDQYGIKNDEILIGNVGRLSEQKNQIFLAGVLQRLDSKYKLMLIGNGDKKSEIEEKIKSYHLGERVIFIENSPEIEKYYSAFDVFVLPSLFEGMPIVPIEAQANGLKCIISKNVTEEADMGNCVSLGLSEDEWAKEIEKIKRSGVAYVSDSYKIEKQAKKLESIYDCNAKISIVIPIYNSEKYLEDCLDSVKAQNYQNIEVVMVNDGSTDNSEEIAKRFLSDKRFKYIYQENSGANIARNTGIKNASGDYIMFVDSDDWIESNTVKKVVAKIDDSVDIVRFGHYFEPGQKKYKHYSKVKDTAIADKQEILKTIVTDYNIRELAFGAYKTNLFEKNKNQTEGMSYAEDYYLNIELMQKANKIIFLNDYLYHYRKNNASSTSNNKDKFRKIKNYQDSIRLCEKIFGIYQKSNFNKETKAEILANMLDVSMWTIYGMASCMSEKEFEENVGDFYSKDIKTELLNYEKEIIAVSKKKSFKYFVFHYRMIKNMVTFDIHGMYKIAKIYDRKK